ncbi:hypothetical protein IMG5_088220, partial [Ichthyophthirius multifiliis]
KIKKCNLIYFYLLQLCVIYYQNNIFKILRYTFELTEFDKLIINLVYQLYSLQLVLISKFKLLMYQDAGFSLYLWGEGLANKHFFLINTKIPIFRNNILVQQRKIIRIQFKNIQKDFKQIQKVFFFLTNLVKKQQDFDYCCTQCFKKLIQFFDSLNAFSAKFLNTKLFLIIKTVIFVSEFNYYQQQAAWLLEKGNFM